MNEHSRVRVPNLQHLILAMLCAAAATLVNAQDTLRRAAEPDWVEPAEFDARPAGDDALVQDGTHYLLADYQVDLALEGRSIYRHFAARAITDEGVAALGSIEIDFDPSFQELTLHTLRLTRGDQVISQRDRAAVRILQRETNLEASIIDGSRTASIILDDVRIGDILEYAYTVRGSNPVFGGREAGALPLQWERPLSRLQLRLLVPHARSLEPVLVRSDRAPNKRHRGTRREYVWRLDDVPGLRADAEAPAWFDPYPTVQWSDFGDWVAVAKWAEPLYRTPAALGEKLEAELAAIRSTHADQESRLLAALRLAQGKVRYLGIEIGNRSHAPSPPDVVFERRFGDCKDKSRLLVSLLKSLDIDAHVALVHSDRIVDASDRPPSPNWFDHAIVQVQREGRSYWLDPTRSTQSSSLATLYQPDFGLALIVHSSTRSLVPMTPERRQVREVHVDIDLRNGMDAPALMVVRTTYQGAGAEQQRSELVGNNTDAVQKQYLNFYASYYPGIESAAPLDVQDSPSSNRLTITEHYRVPDFWPLDDAKQRRTASISAPDLLSYLTQPSEAVRTAPVGLRHPFELRVDTEVRLPEAWPITPETVTVDDPQFSFSHAISGDQSHQVFKQRYRSLADHVPASRVSEFTSNVQKARESVGYEYYYNLGVAEASPWDEMNWSAALIGLFMLGAAVWAARRLHAYDPAPQAEPAPGAPIGLGGWLVLPTIAAVANVFLVLRHGNTVLAPFAMSTWASLTSPGGEAYHAAWAPILLFELGGNIVQLVMVFLVLALWFTRRTSAPRMYTAYLWFSLGFLVLDLFIAGASSLPGVQVNSEDIQESVRAFVAAVIWTLYFQRSQRVKATFTRRRTAAATTAHAAPSPPELPLDTIA
ncbi:MAG: DUF3857 domain-containing protein [Xanthomonadales bacterium]|nr:DUF3857 domain-containing protein [Xanthomonadales bacterium]